MFANKKRKFTVGKNGEFSTGEEEISPAFSSSSVMHSPCLIWLDDGDAKTSGEEGV